MVSLKTHNILDYVAGVMLLLSPFLFGFGDVTVARNVFMMSGFFLVLYSLFTNYDYAVLRVIPLGVHMSMDVLLGVFLMIAPWVLNYRVFLTSGQEYLHYILGVGVIGLVGLTREKTETDKVEHGLRIEPRQHAAGRI